MLFVAVSTATVSTADRLRQIPLEFWLNFGLGVLAVVVTVILLRKLAHVNKTVLFVGSALLVSIIGFSWIYERNEPTWATPAVSWLSGFFPSKGKLAQKHS